MKEAPDSTPSPWAQRMGYAGLIPFVALAIATWLFDASQRATVGQALLGYAATIASFIGALHWGLVMRTPSAQTLARMGWGVTPSLLAWLALLMRTDLGLLWMAAVLWACYAVDRQTYPQLQAAGWLRMRLALTVLASGSCLAGAFALLQ